MGANGTRPGVARSLDGIRQALDLLAPRFGERLTRAKADEADKQRIWNDSGVSNYFTSRYGRSAVQSPFSGYRMWEWYRDPSGEYALRDLGPSHNEGSLVRPYFGADLVIQ